jgi:ankyrin repeat protein
MNCFELLLQHGCKYTDQGYIGLSKKRKNQVITNITGAAAFNNSFKIVKHMMTKKSLADINHLASEKLDFGAKGPLNLEFTGYTPLMLGVAGGGQNMECVRILLDNKADVKVTDPIGNSVLHIAVLY